MPKSVLDVDIAKICLKCEHRDTIYSLLNVPFCDFSSTTCSFQYNKRSCEDYYHKQPKQLYLFD